MTTHTISFKVTQGDIASIQKGDFVSVGLGTQEKVATPYTVTGITPQGTGYNLELQEYNEAFFDTGDIPPYTSNITQKPPAINASIPQPIITRADVTQIVKDLTGDKVFDAEPDPPHNIVATATKEGIELSLDMLEATERNNIDYIEWQIDYVG